MINKFIDYFILNLKNNKSKNNGKIIINIINHTFLCVKFLFCIARRTLQPLVEPSIRLLIQLNKILFVFLPRLLLLELLSLLFFTTFFYPTFSCILLFFVFLFDCIRYGVSCCTNFVIIGVLGFVNLHLDNDVGFNIVFVYGDYD